MKRYLFFLILLFACGSLAAQTTTDSTQQIDTAQHIAPVIKHVVVKKLHNLRRDSLIKKAKLDSIANKRRSDSSILNSVNVTKNLNVVISNWEQDSFKYSNHPYFKFTDPVHYVSAIKTWNGKEDIFYSLIAILIFFALIKNGFHRYVADLFRIFFRTSIRQRQIKDQLIQSPLPSLLLNIFFIVITGLFIDLLVRNAGMGTQYEFWTLFLYAALALVIIYGIKFISLKFFGWVFQISDTIDTYIFIVFTTNKVAGIFLLPFVIMLSFSYGLLHDVTITLSITLVVALFAYRYFLSYISVQRQLKMSLFHFIVYFCAFEVAPILLLNKLLFRFLT